MYMEESFRRLFSGFVKENGLYRLYQEVIGKINMENYKISLRTITEDNFIEAFNFETCRTRNVLFHVIRSLAQAYVLRNQCQPFGIYKDHTMIGYVIVIYDYDIPEYDICHMMIDKSNQGRSMEVLRWI